MTSNVDLMRSAKASLQGNWGNAALTTLVMMAIIGASGFVFVGPLVLTGPLTVGYILFLRSMKLNDGDAKLEKLFDGFQDFVRAFLASLLVMVFVFLWSLLLVIPGIIMAFSYSMTLYIIAEDKEISARDAIRKSSDMMRGYKWKLFCLQLRFIGWMILAMITCGIGMLWLQPYMQMATLNFYYDVKADWEARNGVKVPVDVDEIIAEAK